MIHFLLPYLSLSSKTNAQVCPISIHFHLNHTLTPVIFKRIDSCSYKKSATLFQADTCSPIALEVVCVWSDIFELSCNMINNCRNFNKYSPLIYHFVPIIYSMQKSNKIPKSGSFQKWRCPVCEFDNLAMLSSCQMCESPKAKDPKQIQNQKEKERQSLALIQCPNKDCKHMNSLSDDVCSKCDQPLFPDESDDEKKDASKKSGKETLPCRKCNFENDPENKTCVNCLKRFLPRAIPKKSVKPKYAGGWRAKKRHGIIDCPKCGEEVRLINFATMETDICMKCQEISPFVIRKYLCLFCDKRLTPADEKAHDQTCPQRKKFYSRAGNPTFDRCTDLQYDTMIYMHKKCEKLHYRKEEALVQRIKKLGYTQKDLENLHHYIIHYAPIIIHMHVNTHFHFFLKDTHYRNQFETSMSSGSLSHSARTGWEDRMFDRRHHSATGFERVKYGTMNFTNDPTGVKVCVGYGQSYFLLKPHVRDRCTITDMDSSSASATLGTFRFIFHLLMKLSDAELTSAFEGSKGKEMLSNVIGAYKQIQIHGPVEFAKDIERVYISKAELKLGDAKALLEQVKTFCSKNNVEYELFQNTAPAIGFGGGIVASSTAPERIVGDKKQLTEEDLKPPPPPPAPAFGFGGHAGFGGFAPSPSLFSFPAPSAFAFGGGFHSPAYFVAPKPPQKKKEYGVDYI